MPVISDQNSYNIRNQEIEDLLRFLAKKILSYMPKGWGFNLLLFSYGEKGALFYISSAQREDVIKVMKEFIARNEH